MSAENEARKDRLEDSALEDELDETTPPKPPKEVTSPSKDTDLNVMPGVTDPIGRSNLEDKAVSDFLVKLDKTMSQEFGRKLSKTGATTFPEVEFDALEEQSVFISAALPPESADSPVRAGAPTAPLEAAPDFTKLASADASTLAHPRDRVAASLIQAYSGLKNGGGTISADRVNLAWGQFNSLIRFEAMSPEYAKALQEYIAKEFNDVKFPEGRVQIAAELNPKREPLPEAFAVANNKDSVSDTLSRFRSATSSWTDISQHKEAIEQWVTAKKWLDNQLKEEAERVKGQCPKDMSPREFAESMAREGKGNPNLAAAYTDIMGNRPAVMDDVDRRLRDVQRAADLAADSQKRPRTTVTADVISAEGRYEFGKNTTEVRIGDLLNQQGAETLRKAMAHELVHQNQDMTIVRAVAKTLSSTDPTFDPKTPDGMRRLQSEYKKLTTNELDSNFAEKVFAQAGSTQPSDAEVQRGLDLAKELKTYQEKVAPINKEIATLDKHLATALEKPEAILESMKDPAFRKAVFGAEKLDWYDKVVDRLKRGVVTDVEAAEAVADALSLSKDKLDAERSKHYENSLPEKEAWKVSAMADSIEVSFVTDVAADRARTKELLDAAAAKDGDPLHPKQKGADKVRAAYEAAIANGSFTSKDVEKILALPSETRMDVEGTLASKLNPSAQVWQRLMTMTPEQVGNYFTISGQKYVNAGLEMGFIDGKCLELMAKTNEKQSKQFNALIEAVSGKPGMTPEAFHKFLEMHIGQKNSFLTEATRVGNTLTPVEIHSALTLSGRVPANANALLAALNEGRLTPSQLQQIEKSASSSRTDLAELASLGEKSTTQQLIDGIADKSLTEAQLRGLKTARANKSLTHESLEKMLSQNPEQRRLALDVIASAVEPGPNQRSVDAALSRARALEKYIKNNMLTHEQVVKLSSTTSQADLLFNELLSQQEKLTSEKRISGESMSRLVNMASTGEIPLLNFDGYRRAIASGDLSEASLRRILALPAESRAAYEAVMNNITSDGAPKNASELLDNPNVSEVKEAAKKFGNFRDVLPDTFRRNAFDLGSQLTKSDLINASRKFVDAMHAGDYAQARSIVSGTSNGADTLNIHFKPVLIKMEALNSKVGLEFALAEMLSKKNAIYTEESDPNALKNGQSEDRVGKVCTPEANIELPDGKIVRLRDASKIKDKGMNFERDTTLEERALIEGLQQSEAGKAILAKEAIIYFEERLIHANQHPRSSGGVSVKLLDQFKDSAEYPKFRAQIRSEVEKTWSGHGEKVIGDEFHKALSLALREIDVAAALREAGLSTEEVMALLGRQHPERDPFFEFLKRTEATEAPAAAKPVAEKSRLEKQGTLEELKEAAERFNQRNKGNNLTAEIISNEFARLFVGNNSDLTKDAAFKKFTVSETEGKEAKLTFKTSDGKEFTPLYRERSNTGDIWVAADGTKVAVADASVTLELPKSVIEAANSADPTTRANARAQIHGAVATSLTAVDQVSTRAERLASTTSTAVDKMAPDAVRSGMQRLASADARTAAGNGAAVEARLSGLPADAAPPEPLRVNIEGQPNLPVDEVKVTFEDGQLKAGDPRRPETMRPLDHVYREKVKEIFDRQEKEAEKIDDKTKREEELTRIRGQRTLYNSDSPAGQAFRDLYHAKLAEVAREPGFMRRNGVKTVTSAGVVLSFLIVANAASAAFDSKGKPTKEETKPGPGSDSRDDHRRGTGSVPFQPETKPTAKDSRTAVPAPQAVDAAPVIKPEQPTVPPVGPQKIMAKAGTQPPAQPDVAGAPKEKENVGDKPADLNEIGRQDLQAQLKNFMPVVNQLAIESQLAKVPGAEAKLGFDTTVGARLVASFDENGKLTFDATLQASIKKGLGAGNYRADLTPLLTKYSDGTLTPEEGIQLRQGLGIGVGGPQKGIYKSELLQKALEQEFESKSWGPMSQSVWAGSVDYATFHVNHNVKFLSESRFRYLPTDSPLQIPPGMDFATYQEKVRSGELKANLGIDTSQPPDVKAMEKFYLALGWKDQAEKQIEDHFREADYKKLKTMLSRMGRSDWTPREPITGDSKAWDRRLREVAPVAATFSKVEATQKAVESLLRYRSTGGKGWVSDAFGSEPAQSLWMDQALKDLDKLRDDRGFLKLPNSLESSTEGRERMAALQQWLDKYEERVKEQYLKVFALVNDNKFVMYGDRPKVDGLDPDVGKPFNLVRDDFSAKFNASEGVWEVRQSTKYAKSRFYNVYDIAAETVHERPVEVMKFKPGELVPVFEPKTGQLSLVEVQHLPDYHSAERKAYYLGKTVEIGVDATMMLAGGAKVLHAGASLAAKEGAKATWRHVILHGLKNGGLSFALGSSGIAFSSAHWRDDSQVGKVVHTARTVGFVGLAGVHLLSAGKSGIGWATGGRLFKPSNAAAELGTKWKDLTTLGKTLRTSEYAALAYFLPLSGKEFAEHFKKEGPNGRAELGGDKAKENIQGFSNKPGVDLTKPDDRAAKIDEAREIILNATAKTLACANKDQAEKLLEVTKKAAEVLKLPTGDAKRVDAAAKLSRLFSDVNVSAAEKTAAAISLLELGRKSDGTAGDAHGSWVRSDLLMQHLRERMSAENLGNGSTTPEQALAAGRARLSFGDIPHQDYAHLCNRIARMPAAAADTKMQALTGLGMMMWKAEDAEANFKDGTQANEYWVRSNGASRRELEEKITEIASGQSGESNPDLRAMATIVLFAMNRDDRADRAQLLSEAIAKWNESSTQPQGTYAKAFTESMLEEMKFKTPADPSRVADAKTSQFLAAAVMSILARDTNDPALQKTINSALADCVNPNFPQITAQAIKALFPDRWKQLPPALADSVRLNAIDILYKSNSFDLKVGAPGATKAQIIELLPQLLSTAGGERQRQQAVQGLQSLVSRENGNKNYAFGAPDLRYLAVEALGKISHPESRKVLEELLKFDKTGTFNEPSAGVRIAALQALHRAVPENNPAANTEFKRFIAEYAARETDPRAKMVAEGIAEQRKEHPVPGRDQVFNEYEKITNLKPVLPTLDWAKMETDSRAFLDAHFGKLNKGDFDKKITDASPDYSGVDGGFQEIADTVWGQYKRNIWAPGNNPGAKDFRREEREKASDEYLSDFYRLRRWAAGDFKEGDPLPPRDKKVVQLESMQALALLVKTQGNFEGKQYLRDIDREQAVLMAAASLAHLCSSDRAPEVRLKAKDHLVDLLLNPNIHPTSRFQLVHGLDKLFDFGAEQIKPGTRSQALLTKEEASQITALALLAHRRGQLPEGTPEPTDPRALKDWTRDTKSSTKAQEKLMEQIVFVHQNREAASLIKGVLDNTADPKLREKAQLYLDRTMGVQVRATFAQKYPESTASSVERARTIADALGKVNDLSSAHEAVDAIFKATYGRPFGTEDERIPILRQALSHPDELVRLAATHALLSQEAVSAQLHLGHLGVSALIDLEKTATNPVVKREAALKLTDLDIEQGKKMIALQRAIEEQRPLLASKDEKAAATAKENITKYEGALKSWKDVREEFAAMRKGTPEGIELVLIAKAKNLIAERQFEKSAEVIEAILASHRGSDKKLDAKGQGIAAIFASRFEHEVKSAKNRDDWDIAGSAALYGLQLRKLSTNGAPLGTNAHSFYRTHVDQALSAAQGLVAAGNLDRAATIIDKALLTDRRLLNGQIARTSFDNSLKMVNDACAKVKEGQPESSAQALQKLFVNSLQHMPDSELWAKFAQTVEDKALKDGRYDLVPTLLAAKLQSALNRFSNGIDQLPEIVNQVQKLDADGGPGNLTGHTVEKMMKVLDEYLAKLPPDRQEKLVRDTYPYLRQMLGTAHACSQNGELQDGRPIPPTRLLNLKLDQANEALRNAQNKIDQRLESVYRSDYAGDKSEDKMRGLVESLMRNGRYDEAGKISAQHVQNLLSAGKYNEAAELVSHLHSTIPTVSLGDKLKLFAPFRETLDSYIGTLSPDKQNAAIAATYPGLIDNLNAGADDPDLSPKDRRKLENVQEGLAERAKTALKSELERQLKSKDASTQAAANETTIQLAKVMIASGDDNEAKTFVAQAISELLKTGSVETAGELLGRLVDAYYTHPEKTKLCVDILLDGTKQLEEGAIKNASQKETSSRAIERALQNMHSIKENKSLDREAVKVLESRLERARPKVSIP